MPLRLYPHLVYHSNQHLSANIPLAGRTHLSWAIFKL